MSMLKPQENITIMGLAMANEAMYLKPCNK